MSPWLQVTTRDQKNSRTRGGGVHSSHIQTEETPEGRGQKFAPWIGICDVVKSTKFVDDCLRGLGLRGVTFPLLHRLSSHP